MVGSLGLGFGWFGVTSKAAAVTAPAGGALLGQSGSQIANSQLGHEAGVMDSAFDPAVVAPE